MAPRLFSFFGSFVIVLDEGTPTDDLPSWDGLTVEGNRVQMHKNGSVQQLLGELAFMTRSGSTFTFGDRLVRRIERPSGEVLWRQPRYEPAEEKVPLQV